MYNYHRINNAKDIKMTKEIKHKYFNLRAIAIRGAYNLSNEEISKITGMSIRTVTSWFSDPDSLSYRAMSEDSYVKLIATYPFNKIYQDI